MICAQICRTCTIRLFVVRKRMIRTYVSDSLGAFESVGSQANLRLCARTLGVSSWTRVVLREKQGYHGWTPPQSMWSHRALITFGGLCIVADCLQVRPVGNGGGAGLFLSSPGFVGGMDLHARYTCDGDKVSPQLCLRGIPGTESSGLPSTSRVQPIYRSPNGCCGMARSVWRTSLLLCQVSVPYQNLVGRSRELLNSGNWLSKLEHSGKRRVPHRSGTSSTCQHEH